MVNMFKPPSQIQTGAQSGQGAQSASTKPATGGAGATSDPNMQAMQNWISNSSGSRLKNDGSGGKTDVGGANTSGTGGTTNSDTSTSGNGTAGTGGGGTDPQASKPTVAEPQQPAQDYSHGDASVYNNQQNLATSPYAPAGYSQDYWDYWRAQNGMQASNTQQSQALNNTQYQQQGSWTPNPIVQTQQQMQQGATQAGQYGVDYGAAMNLGNAYNDASRYQLSQPKNAYNSVTGGSLYNNYTANPAMAQNGQSMTGLNANTVNPMTNQAVKGPANGGYYFGAY